jgi:hypothetical protein
MNLGDRKMAGRLHQKPPLPGDALSGDITLFAVLTLRLAGSQVSCLTLTHLRLLDQSLTR